ncbi:immunoglobulin domain-containing protein, partial [Winogradskyella flava]|uniref:immunoglobulin domain-containing protein n=1 Tax=Winogradskyella flava TaxID=1884876 RepID=UPI003CD0D3FE
SASVNAGETIDWYDAASGGTLLLSDNTSFTPTGPGTYYAETRVLVSGCTSAIRTAVTLTEFALPTVEAGTYAALCEDATAITLTGTPT